jgi:hypothetical protein
VSSVTSSCIKKNAPCCGVSMKTTGQTSYKLPLILIGVVLLVPGDAFALQTHGESEGLWVHQMAHMFYMFALGYLYWDTKRSGFKGKGWRYLRVFCVLTILWNLLTVIGHAAEQQLNLVDIITVDDYLMRRIMLPMTSVKMIYYVAKFEHLLMVPALFFLYMSLRSFYEDSLRRDK